MRDLFFGQAPNSIYIVGIVNHVYSFFSEFSLKKTPNRLGNGYDCICSFQGTVLVKQRGERHPHQRAYSCERENGVEFVNA